MDMVMNLSDSVKWWESLEWLSNYWLLKAVARPVAEVATEYAESRAADKSELMTEI
jgi:hypothetical protein